PITNLAPVPAIAVGSRMSILYESIDFKTAPDKHLSRCRIVPGEKAASELDGAPSSAEHRAWLPQIRETHFEWTPKAPGTYTFAVEAIDRDLNYSKPATLVLTAFMPWYANAWILYPGGGLFGASALIAALATARARGRKREAVALRERLLEEEHKARATAEASAAALAEKNTQLEKARRIADEANKAKSQFLASMSHELRTPLNAIIGYSEMMEEEAPELGAAGMVTDLQKVQAAAKHQLGLINDILDLSKIEAGKMTLFVEEFDVAKLINEVQAIVQ